VEFLVSRNDRRPYFLRTRMPESAPSASSRIRVVSSSVSGRRPRSRIADGAGIAWGVYAASCASVEEFSRACIGCASPNNFGVALLDDPPRASTLTLECAGVRAFPTSQLLPESNTASIPLSTMAASSSAMGASRRSLHNWAKTTALLRLLTAIFPLCEWYIKVDTDTFLHLVQLRARLLWHLPLNATQPPDYVGRALHLFSYRGAPLTYMQGGAVVLSRRAAMALTVWQPGNWSACPNRVLRDVKNRKVDAQMRSRCFVRQTSDYAEDLFTGIAMHEGGFSAMGHPCMLSLESDGNATGLRKFLRSRLPRCNGCPISVHPLKSDAALRKMRRMADSLRSHCAATQNAL
jgi:hypothetical protein